MSAVGYVYQIARVALCIPEASWAKEEGRWACVIADANIRSDTRVDVFADKDSIGAPLCTAVEPEDGKARLYAFAKPKGDVNITIKITEVRAS